MAEEGEKRFSPAAGGGDGEDPVLEAKYLDFCSARVADVLLELSPDEMYVLAQEAMESSGSPPSRSLGYDEIVRLATERISKKINLPTFAQWQEAYRRNPDRYEEELLGLWRSELELLDPGRSQGDE